MSVMSTSAQVPSPARPAERPCPIIGISAADWANACVPLKFELAGPVEFSTGDIIILVLAGALMLSALPLIGAAIAYVLYRRRARVDPQTPRPLGRATTVFIAVFVAQLLVTWILSWFYDM
jgi:hypothetical protein